MHEKNIRCNNYRAHHYTKKPPVRLMLQLQIVVSEGAAAFTDCGKLDIALSFERARVYGGSIKAVPKMIQMSCHPCEAFFSGVESLH